MDIITDSDIFSATPEGSKQLIRHRVQAREALTDVFGRERERKRQKRELPNVPHTAASKPTQRVQARRRDNKHQQRVSKPVSGVFVSPEAFAQKVQSKSADMVMRRKMVMDRKKKQRRKVDAHLLIEDESDASE